MVSQSYVSEQLKALGINFHFWGKAELRELSKILVENESIKHCVKGRYEGGYAVLVATDRRLLLIDKKPFFLTLEDVRYDMISEIDYNHRLLEATIRVRTVSKTLLFNSARNNRLRELTAYTQDRMMLSHQAGVKGFVAEVEQADQNLDYQLQNPYVTAPVLMRRRVSRFYSTN